MTIPTYKVCMLPILRTVQDGNEWILKYVTSRLCVEFGLSEDECEEMLPRGNARVIVNRVGWAKAYLKEAGLVASIRWGVIKLTDDGKSVLAENLDHIDMKYLERFPSFIEFLDRKKATSKKKSTTGVVVETTASTPDDLIVQAYDELRDALAEEVLQQVMAMSDKFFERLVVKLLVAMGYGGSIEDAGKAVGKSGDGGIDGIIKEDKLGLGVIVIQAKRWKSANSVSRPEIQSFAGSMEGYGANKGVFITTSTFSKPARDYVNQIQRKIVLVDGGELAGLMIDHGVGVSTVRTFDLKRLDMDLFQE